jgi:hypothetical protein
LRERLAWPEIGGAGAPVGEGDLHVQRHGDQVAGEQEDGARGPSGDVAPEQDVEVEEEVDADAEDFGRASPPHLALGTGARREQEAPGEDVEVEAGEGHDGVVGVFLHCDGDGCYGVPDEFEAAVVGRFHGFEHCWGGCEERDVLDIRVVFLRELKLVDCFIVERTLSRMYLQERL